MTITTQNLTATLIEQPALKAALDRAVKCVARKSSLPVLSMVLLEATPGTLCLSSTNLEVALQQKLHTEGQGTFRVVVPARHLYEALARITGVVSLSLELKTETTERDGESITTVTERTLVIDKAGGQARIKQCLDAEEYPRLMPADPKAGESTPLFQLDSVVAAKEIKRLARYAATDGARPVFTGILFEIEAGGTGKGRLVAADSYRVGWSDVALAEVITLPEEPAPDTPEALLLRRLIMPVGGLETLLSVLPKPPTSLSFALAPNGVQMAIQWDDSLFLTRLIEGTFPNYQAIIPSEPPTRTVVVESDQLLGALEAFGKELFKNNSRHLTRVRLDAGAQVLELAVSSEEAEQTGYVPMQMERPESGGENDILLNAEYLKDAARAFTGPIRMRFWGPQQPVSLSAVEDGEETRVCLIMPLHTLP